MQAERMEVTMTAPQGAPRTSGVHVSSLIRGLAIESGKLDIGKERLDELELVEVKGSQDRWWGNLDTVSQLRVSIGLAWEKFYLDQLEDVVAHPGELELEGIYLTHDGESLDVVASHHPGGYKHVLALHEVKATYKSTKTVGDLNIPNKKNWMWLMQMQCYCKALHTTLAYLHILYLCGDYDYPLSPALHVWKIQFTQKEIDEAWDRVTSYLTHRRQQDSENLMKDTTDGRSY